MLINTLGETNMKIQSKMMSSDEIIKDLMPIIIKLVKQTAYVNPNDSRVTDADVLGIIIAKHLKWDGNDIMQTIQSALEDANYHSLNARIEETYIDWSNEEVTA